MMNSVYEALRTLLRNKELEIKKLEKEIEALRIVLPIVAESDEARDESLPSFDSPRPATEGAKGKSAIPGPDFDNMMVQVKSAQSSTTSPTPRNNSNPEPPVPAKPRASWP